MKFNLPVIYQSERAECGLACLAMVLGFYGFKTTMLELRSRYRLSSQGLTMESLIDIATDNNLASRPLKVQLSNLKNIKLPCILHWKMNHFVVLKELNANGAVIHDPAKGVSNVSFADLNDFFTGIVLELNPTNSFERKDPPKKFSLSQLWTQISGIKRVFTKILILSLFSQLFVLLTPYYMQSLIDTVIPTNSNSLLIVLSFAFFLVLIFQQITTALRSYIVFHFGASFSSQISINLFQHMMSLPSSFFEKRDVGDIVSRFDSLGKIRTFFTSSFIEALIDGVMSITLLVVLFYYNTTVTFIVLLFIALYTVFRLSMFKRFRRLNEENIRSKAKEKSDFIESIQSIQSIMAVDAQPRRVSQWSNLYIESENANLSLIKTKMWYQVTNASIFGIENLIVVYILITAILSNDLTIGMLTAYIAYKRVFVQRYSSLIDKLLEFRMLGLHLERISEVALSERVEDVPIDKSKALEGSIRLVDISYRYDKFSRNILNNISLEIKKGEHVAICGPSGVGKSTLVKILTGLIEPDDGVVLVDNQSMKQFGKRNYRANISIILQTDKLYSGSIMDNITSFDHNPDFELARECALLVNADKFIRSKAMGYNTLIGQMGSTLSGGEKQRIILARALYRKPKLLIMDEATSNLDVRTEKEINKAISQLPITRIIIAHRPQTINNADRVIRLTFKGLISEGESIQKTTPMSLNKQ